MIITATPQPENFPPRIRLDVDSEGDEFLELTILRDGRPIRQQPAVMGLSETFVYDYEAPFGVPVTYSASGSTSESWGSTFTENWSSLSAWTTDGSPSNGVPVVSGGRLKDGRVWRSDVPVTTGILTLDAGSNGTWGLRIGPIILDAAGGPTAVSFRGGANVSAPSGALTVRWSETAATVTHAGGAYALPPGSALPSAEIVANGGAGTKASGGGLGFWFEGELAGFAYTLPGVTNAVAADTSTQLNVPEAWLIHPIQPTLSIPIEDDPHNPGRGTIFVSPGTDSDRTYSARQSIFQPAGRREAVVFPLGKRSSGSWTLRLTTLTTDGRNSILNLLDDQAPVLLRSPSGADWDLPDGWYAVGEVKQARPADVANEEARILELPLTRVAEPPVLIAPQLTWGDLMLRGVKWGDLLNKTWLQMLMGEV